MHVEMQMLKSLLSGGLHAIYHNSLLVMSDFLSNMISSLLQ